MKKESEENEMEQIFDFHLHLYVNSFYLIWRFIFSTIGTFPDKWAVWTSFGQISQVNTG